MGTSLSTNKKLVKKVSMIVAIIVVLILVLTVWIGLGVLLFNSSKISSNIFIDNIMVGGLTPDEAKIKVNEELKKQLDEFEIQLTYGDNTWNLDYEDVGLYFLLDESVEKAYGIGREGNYISRLMTILNLRKNPQIVELKSGYNLSKIEDKTDEISETINRPPVNAKVERKNGKFIITKETLGMEVDKEILKAVIIDTINGSNSASIDIEVKNVGPEITEMGLSSIGDLIGKSITMFDSGNTSRAENIRVAAGSVDSTVLMPGDEFSFNDSTGPRIAAAGYKPAPIIVDGDFTTGIGGGVCQVSTTLYQSALVSNMEITSRRNHGLPVGYVPLGQDATVTYGYIDLKFRNNKEHPVYIESFTRGGEMHIKLYGKKTDNIHVNLKSEVLETIEPKMQIQKDENMYLSEREVSKEGKKGYRTATYKIYLQGGREIKRELVSKDYYPPRNGIIIEGTKQGGPIAEDRIQEETVSEDEKQEEPEELVI